MTCRAVWIALLLAAPVGAKVFPVTDTAAVRARLLSQVEFIMSLTDEQVRAIAPVSSGGVYFTDCPNCEFGAEEAGCFNTTWDPAHPTRLTCAGCGAVYPDNPNYPDDKFIEVEAPGGGVHRFHYWERDDGYQTFFRAHADYWAREWLQARARDLGDLYHLTGDETYARRALLILDRFAEVYPGWATIFDYPFRPKRFAPWHVTRIEGIKGYRNSRWTWWGYMDIPLPILQAYDGIRAWPGLREVDGGRAAERVETDLITALVEFVLGIEEDYTNMSMGMWRAGIYAGRVLERPEWVHECVRRFEHLLESRFLYDGHWMETSDSYAAQTDGGLRVVMQAADGYSDPPGYTNPVDGRRFDALDLRLVAPGFEAQALTVGAVRLPDNRLIPVNDTWAAHGKSSSWWRARTRDSMEPVLLPATGLAVLGGGEGPAQLHAYLNHTMGAHHKHYDALSLGIFAHGKELAPDIGYTWTNYRLHWPTTTPAHSTVVVNGRNSQYDRLHTGHRLREFVAREGFQLASVDALTAYPGVTDRYRRTLAMIGRDSANAYLIDLFEVSGGNQHDWLLLGSVDEDSTATVAGATLTPFAGTLVNDGVAFAKPRDFASPNPDGHAFGFYEQLQAGTAEAPVLTLTTRLDATPEVGLRTLLAPGPETTVYLGQVPSIRRAQETNAYLDRDKAPAFCVRRQGDGLVSRFAAVHEPLAGEPRVKAIEVIERDGVMALRVDHAGGADWYLQALTDGAATTVTTAAGQLGFQADYALVRLSPTGQVTTAHVVGGSLSVGPLELTAPVWSGTVRSYAREAAPGSRGWFEVEAAVDPAAAATLVLRFADETIRAFNLAGVTAVAGATRLLVKEDPGFEQADVVTRLVTFPQREIAGTELSYRLAGAASYPR